MHKWHVPQYQSLLSPNHGRSSKQNLWSKRTWQLQTRPATTDPHTPRFHAENHVIVLISTTRRRHPPGGQLTHKHPTPPTNQHTPSHRTPLTKPETPCQRPMHASAVWQRIGNADERIHIVDLRGTPWAQQAADKNNAYQTKPDITPCPRESASAYSRPAANRQHAGSGSRWPRGGGAGGGIPQCRIRSKT